jgi:ferredoxin
VTTWRITVDEAACIHSGLCLAAAPDLFAAVDGPSRPVLEEVQPDETAVEAAEGCPMEAIRVLDARSGTVVAPEGIDR